MTAWQEGAEAFRAGKRRYENPHTQPSGRRNDFIAWLAGYYFAEQQFMAQNAEEEQDSVIE